MGLSPNPPSLAAPQTAFSPAVSRSSSPTAKEWLEVSHTPAPAVCPTVAPFPAAPLGSEEGLRQRTPVHAKDRASALFLASWLKRAHPYSRGPVEAAAAVPGPGSGPLAPGRSSTTGRPVSAEAVSLLEAQLAGLI